MKEKGRTILSVILTIIVSIALCIVFSVRIYVVFLYPMFINNTFTDYVVENNKEVFETNQKTWWKNDIPVADFYGIQNIPIQKPKIKQSDVVGGIYIPEINTKLPITKGTNKEYPYVSASIINQAQSLDARSLVLGTYYIKDKEVLFNNIYKLSTNSLIYVTDKTNIYAYSVLGVSFIPLNQGEIKQQDEGLTLVTGYDKDINNLMVINAKLVTKTTYNLENVGQVYEIFGY